MANADTSPHQGQGEPVNRSGLIRHITPEFATAIEKLVATGLVAPWPAPPAAGAGRPERTDSEPDRPAPA